MNPCSLENSDATAAHLRRNAEPQDVATSGGAAGVGRWGGMRHSSSCVGFGMSKSESAVSLSQEDGCPTCLDGQISLRSAAGTQKAKTLTGKGLSFQVTRRRTRKSARSVVTIFTSAASTSGWNAQSTARSAIR